jgi:hypothetical protein
MVLMLAFDAAHAQEAGWREDNRRVSNGDQVRRVAGFGIHYASPQRGEAIQ